MDIVFVLHHGPPAPERPGWNIFPLPRVGDRVTFQANEYGPSGDTDHEYVVTEIEYRLSHDGFGRVIAVHLNPATKRRV